MASHWDPIRRLKRDNPNIEKSIFNSIHAVSLDTMPGYKTKGTEHSFLEQYEKKVGVLHHSCLSCRTASKSCMELPKRKFHATFYLIKNQENELCNTSVP